MAQLNVEQLKSQIQSGDVAALTAALKSGPGPASGVGEAQIISTNYDPKEDAVSAVASLKVTAADRVLAVSIVGFLDGDDVAMLEAGVIGSNVSLFSLGNASKLYSGKTLTAAVLGIATTQDGKEPQGFGAQANVTIGG